MTTRKAADPLVRQRGRPRADRPHGRCHAKPCHVCLTWSPEEDARLVALAGTLPIRELVAALNEEFGDLRPARTVAAVTTRMGRRGLSLWVPTALTLQMVAALFGTTYRVVRTRLLDTGLLAARQTRGAAAGKWLIEPADLERFIRAEPWAYDWTAMAPGRWRALAEVVNRADPWVPPQELGRYLGRPWRGVWRRRRQTIPHRRRFVRSFSCSAGLPVLRARDFPAIAAALGLADGAASVQGKAA